ncbi:MAG: NUDIX domain-containing protein [Deltaproteobacteria bacterium]|jgi:ADP-ribose pyrophosphatase YjhB (NUDIX family)|nr:NUDIX domain-containing protein [Deltaproteobacteria bacterium]MBT7715369.1 NUDIX domain-containing protein [Deltaproteobacteria bacterium]
MTKASGVKAIIVKDGKVLVLVENDGRLDLPGGRVEENEDLSVALDREIFEETGLSVKIREIVLCWSFEKTSKLRIDGATYLCSYVAGKVRLSHEHSKYFWAKTQELDRLRSAVAGRFRTYLNCTNSIASSFTENHLACPR